MNSNFDEGGFDALFGEPERTKPVNLDLTGYSADGYHFEKRIADQPASQVYVARDIVLHRQVAVKVLKQGDWLPSDGTQRFLAEGRILASLKHPNVVQIYGFSEVKGLPCLFMEYVSDGTLATYLDGPCNPLEAAQILLRIARGVASAHRAGIIHRDLKPENILIDRSINEPALQTQVGFVKVTDFGIAKILQNFESLTLTGMQPGTLIYMSPEQVSADKHNIGPATDVFSLGVIFYLLLTGVHPFSTASVPQTLKNILEVTPTKLSEQVQRVPPWLDQLCFGCLEKTVTKRIPDAHTLAEILELELQGYARKNTMAELTVVSQKERGSSFGVVFVALSIFLLLLAILSSLLRR